MTKCTNLIILRWGTVYAHQNLTAKEHFSDFDDGLNHTNSVPAVSWWKVGKVIFLLISFQHCAFDYFQDVLGMSEWPAGVIVDPHTMEQVMTNFPES